ncbi:hypothetical protein BOX15_Mlig002398g1 [Macrostomum lignano]|uniref:Uncharacterized protein n=1 Tax=Macrostomum lignano TaxID=282301 RepID=A0A267H8R2_9PLAT|nr:hypothetical protein BOX15_Mlig002398g1 [Macrostomum lignano]
MQAYNESAELGSNRTEICAQPMDKAVQKVLWVLNIYTMLTFLYTCVFLLICRNVNQRHDAQVRAVAKVLRRAKPSDLLNTTEKQVHIAKQNHRNSMSTSAASFGLRQLTGLSSHQIIP